MINASDFLDLMDEKEIDKTIRFGKVDSAHTTGRPKIIFDGTDAASVKKYPYISTYTPTANDRVIILKNVILGKIV